MRWLLLAGPALLLVVCGGAVLAGALAHLAGAGGAGDRVWMAAGALGAAFSLAGSFAAMLARRLGVDLIAVLALVGALAINEALAAAVIALMVATGAFLERWAERRARRDLSALFRRAPVSVRRRHGDATEVVDVAAIEPGDELLIASGEVVCVDGEVMGGLAVLDESSLTGEAVAVERGAGETVRSGASNAGPAFVLRATAGAAQSTQARLARLVEQAERERPDFVRLADRFALGFLGLSLGLAGLAAAIGGAERAVAVLVVATPCPLILAAPIAFVAAQARSARRGVVIKGGTVLERLGTATTLLLDKTGTVTEGRPEVVAVLACNAVDTDAVLARCASLEQASAHVFAAPIVQSAQERSLGLEQPSEVQEEPGRGLSGRVGAHLVLVGGAEAVGFDDPRVLGAAQRAAQRDGASAVYVVSDGVPMGAVLLEDRPRRDAARTIRALRRSGIERVVIVSGDRPETAARFGRLVGADEAIGGCSPSDKVEVVRAAHGPVVMVGDGINDAAALALADVGVAMAARGASITSDAADVVLLVDRLERLGEARLVARRARRIATESVGVGMGLSIAAMGVAATGLLAPLWGALLQELIDVAVILNALRALRGGQGMARLTGERSLLAERFAAEHTAVLRDVAELQRAADGLGDEPTREQLERVGAAFVLLRDEIAPHERAEQTLLYPVLEPVLGGSDPLSPMSRAHVEIEEQTRRLGQLIGERGEELGEDDVAELRRLLYGLVAVIELHSRQEEESYFSLIDDA